jgi:hypothetical protein
MVSIVKYEFHHSHTPRRIDTGARGAVLPYYAHIYTAIRRTARHPYTRVLPWGGVTFRPYQHTIFKIVER